MKKCILISQVLFCLLLTSVNGQNDLSLNEAIRTGLLNNYQIRISSENVSIAENNNTWGQSGILPVITANVTPGLNYANDTSALLTKSTGIGGSVNWTVFNGFRAITTKKNLEKLEELSLGNSAIIVENTIQAIILSYYNVLLQQRKLSVIEDLKKLSSDRFNYMQSKRDLGASVTYEVLQAQNAFLSDSSAYLLQDLNYKNALRNLNLLLATPPESQYFLTDSFSVEPVDFQYETLQQIVLDSNKTLINQYINQEILKNNIKLAKSNMFPRGTISTGYNYSFGNWKSGDLGPLDVTHENFYVNFSLAFTIYDGGRIRTAIQNAKIQEQIGQLSLQEIQHQMNNALFNAHSFYHVRWQLLNVANEQLKTAELNLQLSREKYQLGSINSFNFRDVQIIYLNAAITRLEVIYDIIESESEILRLTGAILQDTNP